MKLKLQKDYEDNYQAKIEQQENEISVYSESLPEEWRAKKISEEFIKELEREIRQIQTEYAAAKRNTISSIAKEGAAIEAAKQVAILQITRGSRSPLECSKTAETRRLPEYQEALDVITQAIEGRKKKREELAEQVEILDRLKEKDVREQHEAWKLVDKRHMVSRQPRLTPEERKNALLNSRELARCNEVLGSQGTEVDAQKNYVNDANAITIVFNGSVTKFNFKHRILDEDGPVQRLKKEGQDALRRDLVQKLEDLRELQGKLTDAEAHANTELQEKEKEIGEAEAASVLVDEAWKRAVLKFNVDLAAEGALTQSIQEQ